MGQRGANQKALVFAAVVGCLVAGCGGNGGNGGGVTKGAADPAVVATESPAGSASNRSGPPSPVAKDPRPSVDRRLALERTITGAISPKSVAATGSGLVFAQNMMYRHTITVYRPDGELAATIPDGVELAAYGIGGHPGTVRGGPVEAAATPDHRSMFVSNYSMYGAGFGPEGQDTCTPADRVDPSLLYRVDTGRLLIDGVVPVGAVPKYVAVTPNGRYVLVSNWCSASLSVVDPGPLKEVRRVPLGRSPRGVAVDPNSNTAYVAVMGTTDVAKVDLTTFAVSWLRGVGGGPRHLVLDPAGRYLFVTLNRDGQVAKIDVTTGRVVRRVSTGSAPRSMTIAPDGRAPYVVNYESNTVNKVDAADLRVVQTVRTNTNPIGITYEPTTGRVWVACYTSTIQVFSDT